MWPATVPFVCGYCFRESRVNPLQISFSRELDGWGVQAAGSQDYLRASVQTPIRARRRGPWEWENSKHLHPWWTDSSAFAATIHIAFLCKWIWLLNVGLFDANISFLAAQLSWKGSLKIGWLASWMEEESSIPAKLPRRINCTRVPVVP